MPSLTEDTEFVLVHIRMMNDTVETNLTEEIYVGDGLSIDEKKILLYNRSKEKALNKIDIEVDIIITK